MNEPEMSAGPNALTDARHFDPLDQLAKGELTVRVVEPSGKSNSSMVTPIITGVLIALVPACIGYGVAFLNDLRKSNLDFTNKQIEKLYGPLYALTQANEATWKQFTKTIMKNGESPVYFSYDRVVSPEQTTAWRSWIKAVFQPLNQKIENSIQSNAQLIAGDQMPQVFQEIIAHTEAYKGIIATWKDDDEKQPDYGSITKNTVIGLNYPDRITECVRDTYLLLKKHQQEFQYRYVVYPWTPNEVGSADSCNQ